MKIVKALPPMHPGEMLREEFLQPLGLTPCAARALRKHRNVAPRSIAKINDYAENPLSLANMATELVGRDCMRLRVGDFRALFRETATEIIVLDIGPRGSIYD